MARKACRWFPLVDVNGGSLFNVKSTAVAIESYLSKPSIYINIYIIVIIRNLLLLNNVKLNSEDV